MNSGCFISVKKAKWEGGQCNNKLLSAVTVVTLTLNYDCSMLNPPQHFLMISLNKRFVTQHKNDLYDLHLQFIRFL